MTPTLSLAAPLSTPLRVPPLHSPTSPPTSMPLPSTSSSFVPVFPEPGDDAELGSGGTAEDGRNDGNGDEDEGEDMDGENVEIAGNYAELSATCT